MKPWVKLTGAAVCGLMATSVGAADHTDGPAVTADASADIADVYAWKTDDNTELVLIQTLVGQFAPTVQYVFHVGRSDNLIGTLTMGTATWTDIICEFASPTDMECWVSDGSGTPVDYVTGDPSVDPGITSVNGNVQVHAGEHADPFFFYLDGFKAAREFVLTAAGASLITFNADGCPDNLDTVITGPTDPCLNETYASVVRGLLNGTFSNAMCGDGPGAGLPIDNFAAQNRWAIVMEVNKTAISGMGEYFAVYASTHEKQ
jgi:hypothetical protein